MKALASYYMTINEGGCKEHRRTYKMMSSREERRGEAFQIQGTSLAKAGLGATKDLVSKDV